MVEALVFDAKEYELPPCKRDTVADLNMDWPVQAPILGRPLLSPCEGWIRKRYG